MSEHTSDTLKLLHLSDIHFRLAHDRSVYDLDHDLRNEVELDLVRMRDDVGDIDALLVTGDIAFSGQDDEYDKAVEWLSRVAQIVGCSEARVWTVPGNHDVDRSVVQGNQILRLSHKDLRECPLDQLDERLYLLLREDPLAAEVMFRPLHAYNKFAARFGCEIDADNPCWEQDFDLSDGSILRIRGLTSVLVSNEQDDDGANKLVLGPAQTNMPRGYGVTYLTLGHHPPDWLRDGEEVEQMLKARVSVQLFGHKHHQVLTRIDNTLRVVAGAVQPNRREPNWVPRYNVISLGVAGDGEGRVLEVSVYPRIWTDNEKKFGPEYDLEGNPVREHSLPLAEWAPAGFVNSDHEILEQKVESTVQDSLEAEQHPFSLGAKSSMDRTRSLVYQFMSLPYHQRLQIAGSLGLIEDDDEDARDPELSKRFFRRAREQSLVEKLADEVERLSEGSGRAALGEEE